MNYSQFREKTKQLPFFRSNIFPHFTKKIAILRRQLVDWKKKGYVIQLKRSCYTLRKEDRQTGLSPYFLSNNLYSPSYISLETALSYYGFIPERVYAITAITSKKTQRFSNPFGKFIYHHLRPELYDDFVSHQDEFKNYFFIATPERAVIDFFYFKIRETVNIEKNIFFDSFRLQGLSILNKKKLKILSKKFNHKKLNNLVTLFIREIL
ncbi:MAG: hypothetical protein A3I12_01125 [Gammaproteobacteria bacterium RIFCSPLOWO2_02_FULL_38_11]|nr:MAG: hypothetical protein A3B69_01735 [Gammaproteobacteria bacterium RIFCSPHIGHO2_02_FULL_38_33]OGT23290.1 MAG: hypothetical protein A2W47_00595 [Gammaproteobacteria bacterium RIFCSPHIGHO2_12_38_15]OGT68898.1 MAG: hypothetical protein A3I12_01125 [Gammaproteobacteria bacterium RIFCSPLOWO2_02_FULL_38_11]OGT76407.1 MAG: hypothetical protein A3G71_03920 [Gammaproteobacteria bacterium RIFCSPLOWO2_12_FULL_38_14]